MNKLIDDCMKLGFGMMRLPRVEGTNDIDLEHTKRMVDAFMEAGGKYFDTAYIVCGQCQAACPQHLPIIGLLAEVAETLE